MKPVISVLLAFTLVTTMGSVLAQSAPAPKWTPLPNNDCIRLNLINEWHVVDSRTAIVRTGPYQRYLVKLQADCQKLGIGNNGLVFVPNRSEKATSNRICGQAGEMVRSRLQPPCGIQSVSLISEDEFNSYRAKAQYHSVRTQQPVKNP